MRKVIKLTENDLKKIVKKVLSEQMNWDNHDTIVNQMKSIKPEVGGKYCFNKEIVNQLGNDRSYVVYKIKRNDTLEKLGQMGNGVDNILRVNNMCNLKSTLKFGDVILMSMAPSGR